MGAALLLFLSAERLLAQHMIRGKVASRRTFPHSPEGVEQFAGFLNGIECPAYLLADLVEEDFRQEILPHLFGRNRAALYARKFEQFYRATPFRLAILLQRQKTGRRDDQVLLSALTNPALISPWLETMLARRMPVAGIYSVPQISAPLVKDHPARHLLLISWEKDAGLRQTYFSDHRLHISRLTTIPAGMTFQDAVTAELARTYQYLKSLSLLPAGQVLDVRLLGSAHDLIELQLRLPRSADMRYDYVDLASVGSHLKIDHEISGSDATPLFLHHLSENPPQDSYANAEHRRYFTLMRIGQVLRMTAWMLLSGVLMWSLPGFIEGWKDKAAAYSLRQDTGRLLAETRGIVRTFPPTLAPPSDMKEGVSLMRKLHRNSPLPQVILQPLSHVMGQFPRIGLVELSWSADAGDAGAQIMILKGSLDDFASDYRAALEYLDRFRHALLARGYQVSVIEQPLDISPAGSISDRRESATDTGLGFTLQLRRGNDA
ncbi:MAG: hypothetical protein U1C96_07115 [Gallionella sp.]|nr:hypothetical protein [Gallionella sp.]